MIEDIEIVCPYCGEMQTTRIERGATQDYIEDCTACCRPISCLIRTDDSGRISVSARRDDE
ncbi:MAG: CPXCG motif-containing cysteine-rich protein [Gammaproteobacteria bacterium]|nr:CPXCG motif-containing cysteine-rich protein [Gammaproteobacteria bacterium]